MTITKDNIRRILISKGRLLVKEKGADYLTARKLAEASAYSVGTIYNQFGTMDNFVLEQNKQTLDELVRYMLKTPKGESSYQMLNRYLDAFVAFVLANRNLWFLLYNFHLHAEYVKLPKERPLPQGAAGLHELLKLLLKLTSQESGVVAKLIASDDDLKRFATFKDRNNPILKGWRKELFGNRAIELRNGMQALLQRKQPKRNILWQRTEQNVKIRWPRKLW